ncbi:MAG: hypothetical protein JXB88_21015 [Spirochaetales bacterium]|nr:hypothetical protein [Spirochaetales bacterium]
MSLPELHEFHFVIGHRMKIRLEELDVFGKLHNPTASKKVVDKEISL